MTLLALAGVLLFGQLGRWQWHRAAEKRALVAAFEAGAKAPATELGSRALSELPRYALLRLRGQYDGAHQFLLDNIGRDGVAGYEVLTPFQLEDGRCVLVNRGWLPLSNGRREPLPDVSLSPSPAAAFASPQQPVEITGRIDELPVTALSLGRAPPPAGPGWPKRTSFPTAAQLGAALGRPVEARELLLAATEPQGYRRDWRAGGSGFGPERHLAYALQWWGFAALTLFLYVFMNLERRKP
ncbi:MAG: SURF1 family protein [Proteobacteria bacterium]|nr:SURF1 family protein [Pseudomonadota bacterium]